jgi:hypothetical protein
MRWLRRGMFLLLGIVWGGMALWATVAVCIADHHGPSPRYVLAALTLLAAIAGAVFALRARRGRRWLRWAAATAPFLIVLAWYLSLKPSNDRDWAPDSAQLAWAEPISAGRGAGGSGDGRLTIHNVRNFDYRSETDFTPAWEDRTYDLNRIQTVDLILVHWGSDKIAHAIISFGFADGQYLAVSIETRKEKGESYSAVEGFFRQYELIYVFADERDVLWLRTEHRKEDVYLYRTRIEPAEAREMLLSYLAAAGALRAKPEWYNALTTNCATSVLAHARAGGAKGTMSWEVLASGYAARQAYRNGVLDDSMPYEQLRARSRVNDAATAAGRSPDFSARIRAGLPVPSPRPGG